MDDQRRALVEMTFTEPVAAEPFTTLTGVTGLSVHGTTLRCQLNGSPDALLRTATRQYTVTGILATEPPLEDLFHRYYTGASRAA
jgi:ABC-2 type transport system ATP-binding protein